MSFHVDSIEEIIESYSRLSEITCVNCGKPANYISTGWICPWCTNCSKKIKGKLIPVEEAFKKEGDDEQ